jgi:hypothetical protein
LYPGILNIAIVPRGFDKDVSTVTSVKMFTVVTVGHIVDLVTVVYFVCYGPKWRWRRFQLTISSFRRITDCRKLRVQALFCLINQGFSTGVPWHTSAPLGFQGKISYKIKYALP